jgi:hypothetical protein
MFESIIVLLIYIALVVGLAYLILWALAKLGLELPPMVVNVFWVIVVLIVILLLWRMIGPAISGAHLPGVR